MGRLGFWQRQRYVGHMPLRLRSRPVAGFIEPCLPRPADRPPAGRDWLHEIKHDGFRIMARRDAAGVRLLTRNGHDFASPPRGSLPHRRQPSPSFPSGLASCN